MATRFIILSQIHHRPKNLSSTPKSRRCNRNKHKTSKSISENMLMSNNFPGKTLTEIYHHDNIINSQPLTNPLLFVDLEDQSSVKEVETTIMSRSQQEQRKVSSNCNYKDGKSISATKYRDLRSDEVARLSLLWYMKCSISYILRKARAFYNEFCCDTYVERSSSSNTMVVVDPYFSIPVIY